MERTGEILAQSRNRTNIPGLPDIEHEPTDAEKREELRKALHITSWENTFEKFRPRKGTIEALKACKTIVAGKADWYMTLIYGTAGCGKTHLLEAVSIVLLSQGIKCPVWEWSEIMRAFKRAMRSNQDMASSYDVLFERYRKMPRMLIDDVAANGSDSVWAWGEFEDIINYRYRQNLVTVATTNLDYNSLPDRVVSRFRDSVKSRIILIDATDFRPEKIR